MEPKKVDVRRALPRPSEPETKPPTIHYLTVMAEDWKASMRGDTQRGGDDADIKQVNSWIQPFTSCYHIKKRQAVLS
jgi:hypothetical protein